MSLSQNTPLHKIVQVRQLGYASTNIEHDKHSSEYVVGADSIVAVRCIADGMNGSKRGMAVSVIGPYGSGKSTLGLFINRLVGPETEAIDAIKMIRLQSDEVADSLLEGRKAMKIEKKGMIRCRAMARREPIHVTILRAINNGVVEHFGGYNTRTFQGAKLLWNNVEVMERGLIPDASDVIQILRGLCAKNPVMLMIDEFGKNVEYFTDDDGTAGDLFLLQELVESSGKRGMDLGIMTFQHMAFDDYAAGASSKRRREWAKIQGRFNEVVFYNTLAQTHLIVSKMLQNDNPQVKVWAADETRELHRLFGMNYDKDITAKCYPLHPLTLAVLPELCSRYGQNERTILSFMQGGRHTVSRFIEETKFEAGTLPTAGMDILYDYFISGAGTIHGSSASITRLREIETIIRDARGLDETETKTLKTVGILNLIGRSGSLRASRKLVEHMIGQGAAKALQSLVGKTILTYRDRVDEYRVWHGTDIDVSARLGLCRQRYNGVNPAKLLPDTIQMSPIIASRHSIKTGTTRTFQQISNLDEFDSTQDGAILYWSWHNDTHDAKPYFQGKPVIIAEIDSGVLATHILDIKAMKDLLSEPDVAKDWVARGEINERLLVAESELRLELSKKGGVKFSWNGEDLPKSSGLAASKVCDMVYNYTPRISNEIINRNKLTGQAASARNILVDSMVTRPSTPCLGIKGWGAERAIYKAILTEYGIHRNDGIHAPKPRTNMKKVWDVVLGKIPKGYGKVNLEELYETCRMPPFGMKEGVIPLVIIPMMIYYSNRMAVYEHGSFVNGMKSDVAERLVKNPSHFELKLIPKNRKSRKALALTAELLGLSSKSTMLDIVKTLVMRFASLNECARNTKKMDKDTKKIRDLIAKAREPDVLMYKALPEALGFPNMMDMSEMQADNFSKKLARHTDKMSRWFDTQMDTAKKRVLEQIDVKDVKDATKKAAKLEQFVADKDMKPFLTALSADFGDDSSWIEYVAMTLTNTPPANWKDENFIMFENKLYEMAGRFQKLVALWFNKTNDDDVFLLTVTRPDGAEEYAILDKDAQTDKITKTIKNLTMKLNSKDVVGDT